MHQWGQFYEKEIIKTIETDLNDIDDLELMNLLDSLFEDVTSISEYEINKLTENKKLRKIIEDYVIQNNIYFIDDNYINKSVVDQYLEEIGKIKLLDDQEEFELAIKAKNGDKSARARLINANLRLVVSIIKKYYYYTKDIFPDLIGEGNMGLVYSYEKFDPSLGYKFSTYATWWIRLYISKYFENKARNIHIPVSQLQNIKNIIDEKERYMSEFGKNISYDELASRTGLSISKIFELESVSRVPESLDRSVNDEREVLLSDLIVDDNPNPEDIALGKNIKMI